MAGNTVHLSLLSRGVGEVRKNGHEKVDVVLEPEDYHNYTDDTRLYLPPIQPKYNGYMDTARSHASTNREIHELYMPKTFMTRKGALLLFSEDFANKTKNKNRKAEEEEEIAVEENKLHTVEDLSRSILSYGSRRESEVSLFVYDRNSMPRKFRPGFSAKRYLSRLTRSFDDSFLEKLLSSGYVNEKTLFHPNALLPQLRRRINDDISSYPAPYRIMKHMLMAPGILSGYTFYTGIISQGSDGILEEIEEDPLHKSGKSGKLLEIIDTKDGMAKSVSYSDMSKEEKEHVLADLLVKSAINHALETQKQIIDDSINGDEERPEQGSPGGNEQLQTSDEKWGLDMTEAVRSYIESQVGSASQDHEVESELSYATSRSFRGAKIPAHSVKSFEAPKKPRSNYQPLESSREYIGGVPIASIKDTQSISSLASSIRSGGGASKASLQDSYMANQGPSLSPILDVNTPAHGMSREASFNPNLPVPPIKANLNIIDSGLSVPNLNVQPPTPQTSNLTSGKQLQHPDKLSEKTEEADNKSSNSEAQSQDLGTTDTSDNETPRQPKPQRKKKFLSRHASVQSLGEDWLETGIGSRIIIDGGNMVPTGGNQLGSSTESGLNGPDSTHSYRSMKGHALKRSNAGSVASNRKDIDSDTVVQGTLIFGPEGEVIQVGKSVSRTHDDSKEDKVGEDQFQTDQVNQELEDIMSKTGEEGDVSGEKASGRASGLMSATGHVTGSKPASRAPSVSKMSGYTRNVRASTESIPDAGTDGGDVTVRSRRPSKALSEQELVEALSEHAHKIAEAVLSRPETGDDLAHDAQAAVNELDRELQSKSAEPSVDEYKELLKETLASVVSKVSGDTESDLKEAEVSPDLVEALANQEIAIEDIEIQRDEESGRTVIRAKSGASSYKSGKKSQASRLSSRQSLVVDMPSGEITVSDQFEQEPSSLSQIPGSEPTDKSREQTDASFGDAALEDSGGEDELPTAAILSEASSHTMPKAKKPTIGKNHSTGAEPPKDLSMDVINYGEADLPDTEKNDVLVRPQQTTEIRKSTAKSQRSDKGVNDVEDDNIRNEIDNVVENGKASVKSAKSDKKSVKSKGSDEREEFVVGKVKETKELEKLYAPVEEPPKPVEKKPRVPKAKEPSKIKKKPKAAKKKKEEAVEEPAPEPVDKREPTPPPPPEPVEDKPPEPEPTPSPQPTPSPEPEQEEDIEFVIVRDEFSDEEEEEPIRTKSVKSYRSFKSIESKDTDISIATKNSDESEETRLKQISIRDARAAKRAVAAAKKREDIERKRREREDKFKRDKESLEKKELIERELEEERRKKEEDRRNNRARQDEERRREEEEERKQEERQKQEIERQKWLKEEYKRKMEETKLKKIEDDLKKKEQEEQRLKEEEERLAAEEEKMAQMAEQDRINYERMKAEEAEIRRLKDEADRIKKEEDFAIAQEQARRLAEEMARKQLELERRMQFNRSLQLESTGLEHTQEVTRAFVWSYYELLKWLGLDVPEFEKWKATLKF